jgi:hypothetical protein
MSSPIEGIVEIHIIVIHEFVSLISVFAAPMTQFSQHFQGVGIRVRSTLPVFVIHRRWLSQKCCVTARWDDGFSLAIRCFAKKSHAEKWLEVEAAQWLKQCGFLETAA